jgi:hypothetical protein
MSSQRTTLHVQPFCYATRIEPDGSAYPEGGDSSSLSEAINGDGIYVEQPSEFGRSQAVIQLFKLVNNGHGRLISQALRLRSSVPRAHLLMER